MNIPTKQIRVLLGACLDVDKDNVKNKLAECIGVYKKEIVEREILIRMDN